MENFIIDILGWIGSILVIIAYYLLSIDKIKSNSMSYHSLNVVGSFLLIINTYYKGAYPSAIVNIIWVIIGLSYFGKLGLFKRKLKRIP